MPNVSFGKEKTSSDVEKQPLAGAEAKDVATEPLPPQKILKIFSINIIAQGLPFCRRRVSLVRTTSHTRCVEPQNKKMSKVMSHFL